MPDLPSVDALDVLLRLAVAAGLGGAIGFERELRDREAGLRTHMLVCVGSALFTLVSAYGFEDFLRGGDPVIRADPTRIAAQIVTGIGFLGAGAIIRQGLSVRGLTTAATLWVSAAIGISAGAGFYSGAILATAVTLLALWPLRVLGHGLTERLRPEERALIVELKPEVRTAWLLEKLEDENASIESFELDDEVERRIITLTLDTPSERFVTMLADLDEVIAVRWNR